MRYFLPIGLMFFLISSANAAVAFDAKITGSDVTFAAGTSFSSTAMTVGASATCLTVGILWSGAVTTPSVTWNGVTMTAAAVESLSGADSRWFFLSSPATGNHTLAGSWTTSASGYVTAISWTGTSISACVKTSDDVGVNLTNIAPITVTITSATSDATAALMNCQNNPCNSTNFTSIFADTTGTNNAGASYTLGGTSNGHTFHDDGQGGPSSAQAGAGIHIVAPSGAATFVPQVGGFLIGP